MTEKQQQAILAENLAIVEARIASACRRAARKRDEVTLVAVTKSVSAGIANLLPNLGVLHLGESRPQELWRKAAHAPMGIHWHLVGHLQRNKIEKTLPLVELIHSVDSLRLLAALEQESARQNRSTAILLQVNASRESGKHGFAPEVVPGLASYLTTLRHVHIRGLMTMAALEENPELCRPVFAELRTLRDTLQAKLGERHPLAELSMGMTNDFEVAIEEGATLIRIGTALFTGLQEAFR